MSGLLRGSEWRRWDLHVHTPASVLHSEFGTDWNEYVRTLLRQAIAKNISVVGITDYFSVEGYRRLRRDYLDHRDILEALFPAELAANPRYLEPLDSMLFLPNVELRLNTFVDSKSTKRLELHVLFSEETSPEDIQDQFLSRLDFQFAAESGRKSETRSLNDKNLTELGARLKTDQASFQDRTDQRVGYEQATVDPDDVLQILADTPTKFRNRYLIVLPESHLSNLKFESQAHLARKVLMQQSHMMFSSNAKTRERLLSADFAKEFGHPLPCVWGSDAHRFDMLFEPAERRYCWIKADPTFRGLLQLLNEPTGRCFIGELPPLLSNIQRGSRVYIDQVSIVRRVDIPGDGVWFADQTLKLNPEMVTVIGNKGAGKSAIVEILALLRDSQTPRPDFSFLNEKHFKKKIEATRRSPAENFEATITWSTSKQQTRGLAAEADANAIEAVRYLPQGYLEKICSYPEDQAYRNFERELNRVIFSHVPTSETLGARSLDELLDSQTSAIKEDVSELKRGIRDLNRRILALESEISADAREQLERKIGASEAQLESHQKARPAEVPPPDSTQDSPELQVLLSELQARQAELKDQEDILSRRRRRQAELAKFIATATTASQRLATFQREALHFQTELQGLVQILGISAADLVSVQISTRPLDELLSKSRAEQSEVQTDLRTTQLGSTAALAEAVKPVIQALEERLDAPNRRYQQYLADLKGWQEKQAAIVGDSASPDSLEGFRARKIAVETILPRELDELKAERRRRAGLIWDKLAAQARVYQTLYRPVQDFINGDGSRVANLNLEFRVLMDGGGFTSRFLEMIDQAAAGSFRGVEGGSRRLNDLLWPSTFETAESTLRFLDNVDNAVQNDLSHDPVRPAKLEKQLRKGFDPKVFYDFLYCLEYVTPRFELTLEGKRLTELSPGERGLLLLIFYLAIDNESIPLVIDQPEENLDNQSIYGLLVPCLKAAKARRQLIIATHNPNLAVVCDSEQVIRTSIDKTANYLVRYEAGAIENPVINKHVVDVLEGTPPAFGNRRDKYETVGSL